MKRLLRISVTLYILMIGVMLSITLLNAQSDDDKSSPLGLPRINIPLQVSSGIDHTCAIRSDATAHCWGSGPPSVLDVPDERFKSISAGWYVTCGITLTGNTLCWGEDTDGATDVPVGDFIRVSSGYFHVCGIHPDHSITCWGYNDEGQTDAPSGRFIDVDGGAHHTCAVRQNGNVACWGETVFGQSTPPAGSFIEVTAGWLHSCGIRTTGAVECWGANNEDQLNAPAGVFTSVSAGLYHTCGLRLTGAVECWGDNTDGRWDPPAGTFVSVSAAELQTCGVKTDNTIVCWGYEDFDDLAIPLPEVTLSAASDELTEETGLIAITATLSERPLQHVTVTLGFDGSATNGDDYTTSGVSMQINPDNSSSSVLLFAIDDDDEEANEEIEIDITNVVNGTEAGTQQVVVSIPASDQPVNQIVNGGFEHDPSDPAPWVVKNGTKDKVKCNTSSPRVNSGSCAFQFKGSVGESSTLQQDVIPPSGAVLNVGDILELRMYARGTAGTSGKVIVKATYTDGTPPNKISRNLPTNGSYTLLNGDLTLTSPNLAGIRVIVKHQSISGKAFIDDVELIYRPVTQQFIQNPLPLP